MQKFLRAGYCGLLSELEACKNECICGIKVVANMQACYKLQVSNSGGAHFAICSVFL